MCNVRPKMASLALWVPFRLPSLVAIPLSQHSSCHSPPPKREIEDAVPRFVWSKGKMLPFQSFCRAILGRKGSGISPRNHFWENTLMHAIVWVTKTCWPPKGPTKRERPFHALPGTNSLGWNSPFFFGYLFHPPASLGNCHHPV